MSRARFIALFVVIAGLLLASCTRYRAPIVAIGDATIVERTDEATQVDVALDITNPNPEPIEVKTFQYAVEVAGFRTYTGKRSGEATLGSRTTKSFRLPAVFVHDGSTAVPSGSEWSVRGELVYLTPGELAEILLDAGVRRPRVGLSGRGRLDASRP